MILSDREIADLCLNHDLVTPFDPALLNPASIDVRLGDTLLIEGVQSRQLIPYPLHTHTKDDPYELVPGQFCLAQTVETFNLPDNVAAHVKGLEHLMAGYCNPGFHGVLTLELHNSRQLWPQLLWPGMKIGQLVFQRMSQVPLKSYAVTGRYNGDQKATASKG